MVKSSAAQTEIPPGALITFLQKGLEYIAIEENIAEDGTIQEFDTNYSLLSPFICNALVAKEDRRVPRMTKSSSAGNIAEADNADLENTRKPAPSTISVVEEGGNRSLSLKGHRGEVFMCVWNPARSQLASGSADGICRVWGLHTMAPPQWSQAGDISLPTSVLPHCSVEGEKNKDVTSISWSPDGQFLATGCYDGMARIWTAQGELVRKLAEHTGPVFSLKWSKSGKYILSGSYDHRAVVWNAENGAIVRQFQLHSGPVLDVDWKDSDTFATCSSDKAIFICQVTASDPSGSLQVFRAHTDEVNAVAWSPGGALLASCSDDHTAKIYNADGPILDLRGHTKEIFTLRWTPPTTSTQPPYLCTASFDGNVKVWNSSTGEQVFSLSQHAQPVYSLAPSPVSHLLAAGSLGGSVCIWSLLTGELLQEFQAEGDTFDVSWSHDGSLLCCAFSSGKVLVFPANAVATTPVKQEPGTMVEEEGVESGGTGGSSAGEGREFDERDETGEIVAMEEATA